MKLAPDKNSFGLGPVQMSSLTSPLSPPPIFLLLYEMYQSVCYSQLYLGLKDCFKSNAKCIKLIKFFE